MPTPHGGRNPPRPTLAIPVVARLLDDQLTPVLAYRRLVAPDERTAPSFLLESVEGGERQGRYSILGARPIVEVMGTGSGTGAPTTRVTDHRDGTTREVGEDPLAVARGLTACTRLEIPAGLDDLPTGFLGGWAGYASYDSVRFAEPGKLGPGPEDDRHLADVHFGLYDSVVVFDHVRKIVFVVSLAFVGEGEDKSRALEEAGRRLEARVEEIQRHSKPLSAGRVEVEAAGKPGLGVSNLTREGHAGMVARALEYIRAGDVFQVVVGQRFERRSSADPFDVYRALRSVNPSPYMVYMQAPGCILVASSPEILCRVRREGEGRVVTNRPLAGTRRRGATPEEDSALERELLTDPKERAEHIMLVDLGRNDVGRVAEPGTIRVEPVMAVERFSHVMHLSSTVTGRLRAGMDCWDALRAALPVGTISGAPKIRAMQVIDELEPVRRGPYGGGMGYVGLDGEMDLALALRTIVVPTARRDGSGWVYHLQASGGIVADSRAGDEFQETVNKAAALARAVDLAERAFTDAGRA